MATPRGTKPVKGQVQARGTAALTVQDGPVLVGYGATTLMISGYAPSLRGNLALTPRYRRCAVRVDNPEDAAWQDGTAVSTTTPFSQAFNLSGLGSFLYVQPAIGGSSSTSNGEGFVVWQAWTDSTAQIVARQTVQLLPDINTSQTAIIPLGKPFPALGLSGVMVAVEARECVGSPQINFAGRTFIGDPTQPGTWGASLLGSEKVLSSLNEDYNTGNMAWAPTGAAWAQLALKVPAGNFYGTLDITVASKY